jgi:hypothetical protein
MQYVKRILIVGSILAGALSGQFSTIAVAQGGGKLQGKERGHCTLVNVAYGRELYNGSCTIKETIDGRVNKFAIKLGSGEPFLFASVDGSTWMHSPEEVRFRDRGHRGVFRWGDLRLEVDEFD